MAKWLRLWSSLADDKKFKTVSKRSRQPVSAVIAVYIHMLCCVCSGSDEADETQRNAMKRDETKRNVMKRGELVSWSNEDVAGYLEIEMEQLLEIMEAMRQLERPLLATNPLTGRDYLVGLEKRQPIKEDGNSYERVKAFRERQKQAAQETQRNYVKRDETISNDVKRDETIEERRIDKSRKEQKEKEREKKKKASCLSSDWSAPSEFIDFCETKRPDLNPRLMECKFRDFWTVGAGRGGMKEDWFDSWCKFILSEYPPHTKNRNTQTKQESGRQWAAKLIGKGDDDPDIIDI